MRILTIHADWLEFEPKSKALKDAEPTGLKRQRFEECLVVFSAVEAADTSNPSQVAENAVREIVAVAKDVKCKRIVLYPYVHLTSSPADSATARAVLAQIEKLLKSKKIEVSHAPFGWYKLFNIQCKGHPLSELSRQISSIAVVQPPPIKEEFAVMDVNGKLWRPDEYKYKKGEERFRILVDKEALKMELPGGGEPAFIAHCKKFGLDWESMSDIGHMRWGPAGSLLFELTADYALAQARALGIPIYQVRGTNLFSLAEPAIAKHAQLFGDRIYEFEVDHKRYTLRYAACFQQFALLKDWTISYKNLPFGTFEFADSYRLEQSGECLLLFRVRKMTMPDLHILCRELNSAKYWCLKLHKQILTEFKKVNQPMVCLYNVTRRFFDDNRDFFNRLLKLERQPILLRFVPEGTYYWVINVEHHIIDVLGRPREIATWQIDIGNAERFGIKFTDRDNRQKHPLVIHTAILGTLERYLYSIFDAALRMPNPMLPLWLAPVQVRLCPVNDSFIPDCEAVTEQLTAAGIRADIDDRAESIEKKIRDSETAWIPLTVVYGKKEKSSGQLAVRFRESGDIMQMSVAQLVEQVKKQTAGYPTRPLPLPVLLSRRPVLA